MRDRLGRENNDAGPGGITRMRYVLFCIKARFSGAKRRINDPRWPADGKMRVNHYYYLSAVL